MMLLGIVVHSAATYTSTEVFPWPIKDIHTSLFYDYLVLFIHTFRMPVFFVLAGFFAALLYRKKGTKYMLNNRIKRIFLPFIAAMILIAPLSKMMAMHYARNMSWADIFLSVKTFTIYINLKTGHLWFLYYLSMIYGLFHLLKLTKLPFFISLYNQLQKSIFIEGKNAYKTILLFSAISFCFILPQQKGLIDSALGFIPDLFILGTYMVYFVFGYILYAQNQQLNSIFSQWKIHLALGLMGSILYFYTFLYTIQNETFISMGIATLLCTLLSWLMIFGLLGFFLNQLHQESKTLSLLAKSSYWVYLTHLPLTILFGGILLDDSSPHYLKCILVCGISYILLMIAYKLLVERSFIGVFLNGKK